MSGKRCLMARLKKRRLLAASLEQGEKIAARTASYALPAGMSKDRRTAIRYFYVTFYGTAPENLWGDFDNSIGLPIIIMKHLVIPRGSYGTVVSAMLEIHAKFEAEEMYDPSGRIKDGRGAK